MLKFVTKQKDEAKRVDCLYGATVSNYHNQGWSFMGSATTEGIKVDFMGKAVYIFCKDDGRFALNVYRLSDGEFDAGLRDIENG